MRGGAASGGAVRDREPRRDDRADQAAPAESTETHPPGNIRAAIEEVEGVQSDLEKVLEDINEILRVLIQADREKTASEREIDMLRESVRRLRGDRGGDRGPYRPARNYPAERSATADHAPEHPASEHEPEPVDPEPAERDEPAEDDNPA
jgi:hypothetical protein